MILKKNGTFILLNRLIYNYVIYVPIMLINKYYNIYQNKLVFEHNLKQFIFYAAMATACF